MIYVVLLVTVILMVTWTKFDTYYVSGLSNDELARPMTYKTSLVILGDYFPFGPGMGTFACNGAWKFYSPLYYEYNLNTIWGLGEYIVLGKVTPDHFVINKNNLQVVERSVVPKTIELCQTPGGGVHEEPVPADRAIRPALTEDQIHELAGYAKKIEKHYGCYMDMEFALDARTDRLWLVQARPETVWSNKNNKQASKESTVSMNKTKN